MVAIVIITAKLELDVGIAHSKLIRLAVHSPLYIRHQEARKQVTGLFRRV